jgi:putative addiction module component (TIGR02574 family)
MTTRLDTILDEAMLLPDVERSVLALALLDSLPEAADGAVADAWKVEVQQRLADFRSGVVTVVPWSEARARISRL